LDRSQVRIIELVGNCTLIFLVERFHSRQMQRLPNLLVPGMVNTINFMTHLVTKVHGVLESKLTAVIDWLSLRRYDDTHIAVRDRRQKNTGQWFIEKFQTWLAETNRLPFFWCHGIREYTYNLLRIRAHKDSRRWKDGFDVSEACLSA
jgi:hypothetical protein